MSHQLSSPAYLASNVSETTLFDTSSHATNSKPGLEQPVPKRSLKESFKMKLSGSVHPTRKPSDPTMSWEARTIAIL
ncbi:hypothetical protein B0J13DRAFT_623325 [Dactylonectria estremocensis]|uniref:Uncharacterized protein n=1 Tax=Dactylonectria estremocensis TaxID=1079267 RepID=A0A9P9J071_9HYPO|nr:hypothetical protein B0J13DRAFT_623325 [Dactylonectria estremocensis]